MNTHLKQIVLNDEYKGLSIKVFNEGRTFARVVILEGGIFKQELNAKVADALREAHKYIDTIH